MALMCALWVLSSVTWHSRTQTFNKLKAEPNQPTASLAKNQTTTTTPSSIIYCIASSPLAALE